MGIKKLCYAGAAIALAFGLSACSNDSEGQEPIFVDDGGDPTSITLSITRPTTYAVSDPNATANEVLFNNADVFIFANNTLVGYERLSFAADFETPLNDGTYVSKKKINTTTGTKDIYVGVNLPNDILSTIRSTNNPGGMAIETVVTAALLSDPTNGFAMFSNKVKTANFVREDDPDYDTDNMVSVEVERMVAKVTVEKGQDLNDTAAGGSFSGLAFDIRNSNKLIYAMQQKNASGKVIDANYTPSQYNSADFEQGTAYDVPVDVYGTAVLDLTPKYAPENVTEQFLRRETTYASVRAQFVPDMIFDEAGDYVDNKNAAPRTFWVYTAPNGNVFYFDDYDKADEYGSTLGGGTISEPYVNGYCYYNVYLNPDEYYQTYRNDYYKITINEIVGLGNPNPVDPGDPDEPVAVSTTMLVTINIVPWNLVEQGTDLIGG